MKTFLGLVWLCALALGNLAQAATSYTETVGDPRPTTAHVAGGFELESDTIGMYITSSPQLEDGQAGLVRNLVVRDAQGRAISYVYEGGGEGTEDLDIRPAFDAIGLRLTTMMDEFYLSDREDAAPAQRAMAASIFGH